MPLLTPPTLWDGVFLTWHIINDIVYRAFTSAGIPAIKEPTGLIKAGALRPDGMTLTPWSEGQSLTWDVTVVHTLSQTNLVRSVHAAGLAVEAAAARKVNKYASLTSTHLFVPIALKTLGPVCEAALDLLSTLGSCLTERSGDPRERSFLFQRLSIAIQRGNSVALHRTFGELGSDLSGFETRLSRQSHISQFQCLLLPGTKYWGCLKKKIF